MFKGMPVKIDSNSFSVSILTEDNCDSLSEDMLTYPTDDIWKKFDDFLETPPQSPPIKFDLVSDLVELSSLDQLGSDPYIHNADVLHDCMWSGQCIEDNTSSSRNALSLRKCGKSVVRPDTPFNAILSTSPLAMYTSFNDLLLNCDSSNDDMDDSQSSMDDEDFGSSQDSSLSSPTNASYSSKVKESLINDHSYDGSCVGSYAHNYRNRETQSLIYPASHKTKVKCHKINTNKMKIIKATQITNTKQKQQSIAVPTVRIIRNNQHFVVKAKSFIASNNDSDKIKSESRQNRTKCKFSTRRKASTVTSERSAMLAQSHHQFQLNNFQSTFKLNDISCDTSDDSNEMKSVDDKSNKQVPPLRRREHNDSERKRRDHLRNAFLNLRDQIPKLKSAEKRPPRILILHEATSYVNHLNDKQKYLERTRNAEAEKRERLLKRLSNEFKNCQNDE